MPPIFGQVPILPSSSTLRFQETLRRVASDRFKAQIAPITVNEVYLDQKGKRAERSYVVDRDEGPRADTSLEKLAKLRPVFAAAGSVTAGNASQMSDGAAFTLIMSEAMVKELQLEPIARPVSYAATGVAPRIMGIGPVEAVPKALKMAQLSTADLELIELNEAFASQSLAVIRTLKLDPKTVTSMEAPLLLVIRWAAPEPSYRYNFLMKCVSFS